VTTVPGGGALFLLHLSAVGLAGWCSCAGGWIFGKGRLGKGVVLGLLGLTTFLADHWIFG